MKLTWFFSALMICSGLLLFQACQSSKKTSGADSSYACPLHPEITGKKGAHCTKCNMALTESKAPAVFCCPIHKECTSKMSGNCPKCGTPMEQPIQPYSCPMHPEYKGKKGERCPKCNMEMQVPKPGKGVGR
ncbi:MAG: heavy metal-binding domain-containing protein [Saprospiraceae bacterium]